MELADPSESLMSSFYHVLISFVCFILLLKCSWFDGITRLDSV